jgi:DNA-binding response OmpR family regulator
MRGTVLLLDSDRSTIVDVELLRANGLLVHHRNDPEQALSECQEIAPDVIVASVPPARAAAIVSALRGAADYATSIIATSAAGERDAIRVAGADSFLPVPAAPAALLNEIHRALILRRSGRRLPWNW